MKRPSKKFIVLLIITLTIIGVVFGVLISPGVGFLAVLFFGVYCGWGYVCFYSRGSLRRISLGIGVSVLVLMMGFVAYTRNEQEKAFDEMMTRIAEEKTKPMTMEELNKLLEGK